MISISHLKKYFPVVSGIRSVFSTAKNKFVKAVDDVSFDIGCGEVLGLVGESGCGKTTMGRLLVGLEPPTEGDIVIDGQSCGPLRQKDTKSFYNKVQMIFQDPYGSINPQHNVMQILSRPLRYQGISDKAHIHRKVIETLERVGLHPAELYLSRHPHLLSGGQRQRLCIGRAIILDPEFIVADEPISMLDVSIRSGILSLLKSLIQKQNLSMLYITHDLATVGHICQTIAIMYLGKIVEIGPVDTVIDYPRHPYTQALISAIPLPDPTLKRTAIDISGAVPNPIDLPPGCRFSPRCPKADGLCRREEPQLSESQEHKKHYTACHHPIG